MKSKLIYQVQFKGGVYGDDWVVIGADKRTMFKTLKEAKGLLKQMKDIHSEANPSGQYEYRIAKVHYEVEYI